MNDDEQDIYVMNSDGSGTAANLTQDSPTGCSPNCYQGADTDPAWSPDGTQIAYVHRYGTPQNPFSGGGVGNIWVMDANPATTDWGKRSNSDAVSSSEPAWSPDGSQIVYVGATTNSDNNIYVKDATVVGPGEAIDTGTGHDLSPDWQPDPPTCDIRDTSGVNNLTGVPAKDEVICGLGGNDTITGQDGDILVGGNDTHTLMVPSGRATLDGGDGNDTASFAGSAKCVNASLISEFAQRLGTDPLEGVAMVSV